MADTPKKTKTTESKTLDSKIVVVKPDPVAEKLRKRLQGLK